MSFEKTLKRFPVEKKDTTLLLWILGIGVQRKICELFLILVFSPDGRNLKFININLIR
jgi:hypothetical protein